MRTYPSPRIPPAMSSASLLRSPWPVVAGWAIVWIVGLGHYLLLVATDKGAFSWERPAFNLLTVTAWALVTPIVARLVVRFPLGGPHTAAHAGAHLLGAAGMTLLTGLLTAIVWVPYRLLTDPARTALDVLTAIQIRSIFLDVVFYAGLVAIFHALDYQRRLRDRELRQAQLETQLVQAQVEALRMQLNPHFLFNTLHAISSLMDEDVRKARRMLVDLSALLRLSLDSVGEQEVPLEQELAFLDRYLQIEQVRFGDRLSFELDVEEEALPALVPNLLLQPLVENALKHAVAPFAGPGRVALRARRDGDTLLLSVEDDGPGLPGLSGDGAPPLPPKKGIGLRNTRERLERLYGREHVFTLEDIPSGGLAVRIRIPFHTQPRLAVA